MTTTYKSLSVNAVVQHYKEQGHEGNIKLFFKKSEVWNHQGTNNKKFYTVRPLVVKIGNWYDEHINYAFVLKSRFNYIIQQQNADMWIIEIDKETKHFEDEKGNINEYHDTKLVYTKSKDLINAVCDKYIGMQGVSEAIDEDYLLD